MSKTYLITELRTDAPTPEEVVGALTALGCKVLVTPNRGNGNKYIVTGLTINSFVDTKPGMFMFEEFAELGKL